MIRNKKEARETVIIKGEKVTMAGWRENIRKVTPYVPGEQPKQAGRGRLIKLNTNENPYPPAPEVAECLKKMDTEAFRLYPNTDAAPIVEELAKRFGLPQECFFVGVGSDDVLAAAFQTFFSGTKPVLFPDITYSFYEVWAELYRVPYRKLPLDGQFRIRAEDYIPVKREKGLKKDENGGIVLANPNAPTGIYEPLSFVEQIVSQNPDSVVIVDEAYVDFVTVPKASAISLTQKYENLLVVQTFSKSRSMAGIRIGYAMGQPALIRYLNDVKYSVNSYTMNMAALELGAAAVQDEAYFEACCKKIMATRARAEERLSGLGFVFQKSSANFIFVSHKTMPAGEIFERLKENAIYVRWWDKERIDNYLRITIGTDAQMEALYRALDEICG